MYKKINYRYKYNFNFYKILTYIDRFFRIHLIYKIVDKINANY